VIGAMALGISAAKYRSNPQMTVAQYGGLCAEALVDIENAP
jgi:hypothetical protein